MWRRLCRQPPIGDGRAESKDRVGGLFLIEAGRHDEASRLASMHPAALAVGGRWPGRGAASDQLLARQPGRHGPTREAGPGSLRARRRIRSCRIGIVSRCQAWRKACGRVGEVPASGRLPLARETLGVGAAGRRTLAHRRLAVGAPGCHGPVSRRPPLRIDRIASGSFLAIVSEPRRATGNCAHPALRASRLAYSRQWRGSPRSDAPGRNTPRRPRSWTMRPTWSAAPGRPRT